MKRAALFVLGVAGLALAIHVATLWIIPRVIMAKAFALVGDKGQNIFKSPPLATASWRSIVRPSPDLAYSACALDLAKGPARVVVPLTAPYTSVALFSSTSDNYFVRNDRDSGGKELDIIVATPSTSRAIKAPQGVDVIESPTPKTIVIVRRVVESPAALPAIDAIRNKASCARFDG